MSWILQESDVDLRFVFVTGTSGRSIDQLAIDKMHELNIGGRDQQQRGALLLFDSSSRRLRVEVGYGLEAYFPDGFVGYLMREHAQTFFASGDKSLGLRLLLRLLQARIREAVLGDDFDPRSIETLRKGAYLSGGAGAASVMPANGTVASAAGTLDDRQRERFAAQATPEAAYQRYQAWMGGAVFDPNVQLFTPATRTYLARLPMSRAYFDWIFISEFGKAHQILEHDDLAVLYFTGTPLVAPYFFRRDADGWRMDIDAAVRNTVEYSGGAFTWGYRGTSDDYTRAFRTALTTIRGVRRFADGDNRELRTSISR